MVIFRKFRIFVENERTKGLAFSGREFDNLSLSEHKPGVQNARKFACVEPFLKSKIVKYLQDKNTTMTGDDVKKAKIFIAMGCSTAVRGISESK